MEAVNKGSSGTLPLVGNFGIAILIVTVLIKAAFFPLANKSYASMARVKVVQMQALRALSRWTQRGCF